MGKEYNFQKELKDSIFNSDAAKIDRNELLEDIFKAYVAKLFEFNLGRKGVNRLEIGVMVEVKKNLINEFRNTELGEYQKSVEQYEDLFETTIQEIFNDASKAHEGSNIVSVDQTLQINPKAYVNEGGLFIPEHMKK